MPEDESGVIWLTVKQFATAAKVSTQRIYQRLAKDLQGYCKEQNGSKYINSAALALFNTEQDLQSPCKPLAKDLPSPEKSLNSPENMTEQAAQESQGLANDLQSTCKGLANPLQSHQDQTAQAELAALREQLDQMQRERDYARKEMQHAQLETAQARGKLAALDAERKRADAAELQCSTKDKQLEAMQKQLDALTAALQNAQQQAADLTAALATSQALHAGQIRLAMQDGDGSGKSADDQSEPVQAAPKKGFFARIFKRSSSKK